MANNTEKYNVISNSTQEILKEQVSFEYARRQARALNGYVVDANGTVVYPTTPTEEVKMIEQSTPVETEAVEVLIYDPEAEEEDPNSLLDTTPEAEGDEGDEPTDEAGEATEATVETAAGEPVTNCRICGKILTDPKSVANHIGPECASKVFAATGIVVSGEEIEASQLQAIVKATKAYLRPSEAYESHEALELAKGETYLPFQKAVLLAKEAGYPVARILKAVGGDTPLGPVFAPYWKIEYLANGHRFIPEACLSHLEDLDLITGFQYDEETQEWVNVAAIKEAAKAAQAAEKEAKAKAKAEAKAKADEEAKAKAEAQAKKVKVEAKPAAKAKSKPKAKAKVQPEAEVVEA